MTALASLNTMRCVARRSFCYVSMEPIPAQGDFMGLNAFYPDIILQMRLFPNFQILYCSDGGLTGLLNRVWMIPPAYWTQIFGLVVAEGLGAPPHVHDALMDHVLWLPNLSFIVITETATNPLMYRAIVAEIQDSLAARLDRFRQHPRILSGQVKILFIANELHIDRWRALVDAQRAAGMQIVGAPSAALAQEQKWLEQRWWNIFPH
ncbi:hypothetical protein BU16DRAFT_554099 [Lophium mytilinum]|uniref:Uncharacterized protein n=1 Tax=Lophium mytilinum TaxID=390894 RepID=A0A6A6RCD7_9PEZI|nr:hypothetical protein BU16DRAFT_554099 [Lophium mytilinum]